MVMPNWAVLALGLVLGAVPMRWYYQAEQARQVADVARGMTAMSEAYRAEEQRRQASVEIIRKEARDNEELTRSNAYAAGGAAERLRLAGRAIAGTTSCKPGTTTGSEAAKAAADMLADVLARLDEATGELARTADERGVAGETCWRTLNIRGQ